MVAHRSPTVRAVVEVGDGRGRGGLAPLDHRDTQGNSAPTADLGQLRHPDGLLSGKDHVGDDHFELVTAGDELPKVSPDGVHKSHKIIGILHKSIPPFCRITSGYPSILTKSWLLRVLTRCGSTYHQRLYFGYTQAIALPIR